MNHLSVLEPFFCYHDGELVRDRNPKGDWLSRSKDVRLARGYVLKATCRRRFLGWRSNILELSEREVSDAIGPHAMRIAREEDASTALYSNPVTIVLTAKNLQALDMFIGNDDGYLVRQGGEFSKSCSDVTLSRATLLIASLPRSDGSINLSIVVLDDLELQALRNAVEKEKEWKRQMEEKAKQGEIPSANLKEIPLTPDQPEQGDQISHHGLFACCFPSKSKAKSKKASGSGSLQVTNHATAKATTSPTAALLQGQPNNNKSNSPMVASTTTGPPTIVEIGTPSIPPMHRDAVDRTVRQIAQAAASETWDPSWRRIGSADGLTWLLKDGSKMIMVRGTIRAPARSVFEYIWHDNNMNLLSIEPRLAEVRTIEKDLDGTGHTKTTLRRISSEWAYASGVDDEGDNDSTVLRHYHVHPDGTIFVVDLGGISTGGVVISPVQGDDYSCHVAWVESAGNSTGVKKSETTMQERLAPWASNRLGAMNAKLLGDRLHHLSKYGMNRAPYSDFDGALSRGAVVNHNGSSGASVKHNKSSGTTLMKEKMREFDELTVTTHHLPRETISLIESQVRSVLELVTATIPEERKRFRAPLARLGELLLDFLSSTRALRLRSGAQYPFDCILMWLLTSLPTEEAWVEVLSEQIAMRNVEAQTTFGRRLENVDDAQSFSRISQIMSRDRERPPSL